MIVLMFVMVGAHLLINRSPLLLLLQVLALFRLPKDGIGRQFLRVAVATVSTMMTKQRGLGVAYLFHPLVRPLLQLAGGKMDELVKMTGTYS